jgi:hypothetical protein
MSGTLEKVFDFDESDILLNQNGRLSEKQLKLILQTRRIGKIGGRLAFAAIFISIGAVTMIGLYNVGFDLKNNPGPALAFIAFFCVAAFVFLSFFWLGRVRSDLKSGKISTVEGFARHRKKKLPRGLGTAFYVTIGNVKFQVATKAQYEAIKPNINYRFFYIKHPPTQIILSVAEIPVR